MRKSRANSSPPSRFSSDYHPLLNSPWGESQHVSDDSRFPFVLTTDKILDESSSSESLSDMPECYREAGDVILSRDFQMSIDSSFVATSSSRKSIPLIHKAQDCHQRRSAQIFRLTQKSPLALADQFDDLFRCRVQPLVFSQLDSMDQLRSYVTENVSVQDLNHLYTHNNPPVKNSNWTPLQPQSDPCTNMGDAFLLAESLYYQASSGTKHTCFSCKSPYVKLPLSLPSSLSKYDCWFPNEPISSTNVVNLSSTIYWLEQNLAFAWDSSLPLQIAIICGNPLLNSPDLSTVRYCLNGENRFADPLFIHNLCVHEACLVPTGHYLRTPTLTFVPHLCEGCSVFILQSATVLHSVLVDLINSSTIVESNVSKYEISSVSKNPIAQSMLIDSSLRIAPELNSTYSCMSPENESLIKTYVIDWHLCQNLVSDLNVEDYSVFAISPTVQLTSCLTSVNLISLPIVVRKPYTELANFESNLVALPLEENMTATGKLWTDWLKHCTVATLGGIALKLGRFGMNYGDVAPLTGASLALVACGVICYRKLQSF